MKKTSMLIALLLLGLPRVFAAELDSAVALPNLHRPQANRIVSGAIAAEDIGRLRAAGVKRVINLRTEQESQGLNEAQLATGLGIVYHSIPIQGAQSLTKENAHELDEALAQAGEDLTLVHCASGNRVGALIAIREAWIKGRSVEESLAEGKRWGLASLEGSVRSLLEQGAKPLPQQPAH
jgi:uncharacterized protein (TIGR01244 family)